MEDSYISDESGSISWNSSQEYGPMDFSLTTPLRNTNRRKRKVRKVNKLNFVSRETSPVLTSAIKYNINHKNATNRIDKTWTSKNNRNKGEKKVGPRSENDCSPTSPVLISTCTPKRKRLQQKYLFKTELSPLARLSTLLSPGTLSRPTNRVEITPTSPVIMKNINAASTSINNAKKIKTGNNMFSLQRYVKHNTVKNIDPVVMKSEDVIIGCENVYSCQDKMYALCSDPKTSSADENIYEKMFNDHTRLEDSKRKCINPPQSLKRKIQRDVQSNVISTAANNLDVYENHIEECLPNRILFQHTPVKEKMSPTYTLNDSIPNLNEVKTPILLTQSSRKNANTESIEIKESTHEQLSLSPVFPYTNKQSCLISPPDDRIVNKIKSYFHSNLSLESTTQLSISDITQTTQQKICTPVDIIASNSPLSTQRSEVKILTEISTSTKSVSENSITIKSVAEETPSRRRKYKKNGLAGRLRALIKKQRNQIFLWRHEIYLAKNTDFVEPNQNVFVMFAVMKINVEYSNYTVEAMNCNDEKNYLIILNTYFDCNVTVSENSFLKVYHPYEKIVFDFGTVIYNACKFECINDLKNI